MDKSKLIKFIRFGLYLTAFVPLVIFREFISPFNVGKVIVFRSLIEILGAAYVILILKDRTYLPRRDKIFWALLLFVAAFTISASASVVTHNSLWGNIERMGGLWTLLHYLVYFIILSALFTKIEHWHRFLNLTILSGVLSAFYGFGQKTNIDFFLGSGGRARIIGTIGNAALFAGYQLFMVFLSLMMFFRPNTQGAKAWYLFAFAISSTAVLMTAVRGSLLGYGVGLIVFAFLWSRHQQSVLAKRALVGLLGAAVLFVVFSLLFHDTYFVQNSRYLSRITSLSPTSFTVQTRVWAWEAGLKGWSEGAKNIILGWGPENFNFPFSKHFNPNFYTGLGSETFFDRAHNMFVEVLVTMGLLGLVAYLNIFVAFFAYLKRLLKRPEAAIYGIGLTSLAVAYIIHNSFIFDAASNLIVFFGVLGFISYLNGNTGPTPEGRGLSTDNLKQGALLKNKMAVNVVAVVLAAFVGALIYTINILPLKANYATTRGIVAGQRGNFKEAHAKFKEALSYDVPGKYEFRHRFAQYLVGDNGPSTREAATREAYADALAGVDKNIEENPGDFLPYLYGSRLNINLGKNDPQSPYNDEALEYSMKALKLSPTFLRTYHEIAQAHLNKKDYPKAIEYFQKAVDLNPDVGVHYWYLGTVKIESGDQTGVEDLEKAVTVLHPHASSELYYLKLVNIYLTENNFAKIAEMYEKIIAINPGNPQYYASLAVAYAKLGRLDDAERVTRQAVKVDPSFEADARIFLRSIGREF
ncbi:MAG: tetratricopeptide repeat protein [bacterium]|nr:tetratricopeptide repeat protein [bacterium]